MDFGASKVVSAIVLQGRQDDDLYVTKYKVQYSDGEDLWSFVTNAHNDSAIKVRSLQNGTFGTVDIVQAQCSICRRFESHCRQHIVFLTCLSPPS